MVTRLPTTVGNNTSRTHVTLTTTEQELALPIATTVCVFNPYSDSTGLIRLDHGNGKIVYEFFASTSNLVGATDYDKFLYMLDTYFTGPTAVPTYTTVTTTSMTGPGSVTAEIPVGELFTTYPTGGEILSELRIIAHNPTPFNDHSHTVVKFQLPLDPAWAGTLILDNNLVLTAISNNLSTTDISLGTVRYVGSATLADHKITVEIFYTAAADLTVTVYFTGYASAYS